MKRTLFLAAMLLTTKSFAATSPNSTISSDCSQAEKGIVKITSTNSKLNQQTVVDLATKCLSQDYAPLRAKVVGALKKVITEMRESGATRQNCKEKAEKQILVLESWGSKRPEFELGPDGETMVKATNYNDRIVLVSQPIVCDMVGTGLWGGVVSSVSAVVEVREQMVTVPNSKEISSNIYDIKVLDLPDVEKLIPAKQYPAL